MRDVVPKPIFLSDTLALKDPIFLAPMSGITDMPFRSHMKNYGAGVVVSELISADGIHFGGQKTRDLLRFNDKVERPFGLQLFGSETERFVEAAKVVEELGVDFVDLNLGCPVNKVVKRGAGSALLKSPIELGKLLEEISGAIQIPLTIKIRTGWDDSSVNASEIAHIAYESGVKLVSIHGRTRAQSYSGLANWDLIGEVASKAKLPIIGNGDLVTAESAIQKLKTYPISGVMIGRGALKNPFIFQEIKVLQRGGALEEINRPYATFLIELLERLQSAYSPKRDRFVLILMKKYISWYSAGFPNGAHLRRNLFEIPTLDEIMKRALDFFETVNWQERKDLSQFLMGGHG